MRPAATALALLLAAAVGSGCAGDNERREKSGVRTPARTPDDAKTGARSPDMPRLPQCPAGTRNCRRAGGRVLYVERVDPDGGGDAHVVLASRQGITAAGITVVDIESRVRPARPGDWVGAAGPVYRGSHRQRQIEATELRVRRAGR